MSPRCPLRKTERMQRAACVNSSPDSRTLGFCSRTSISMITIFKMILTECSYPHPPLFFFLFLSFKFVGRPAAPSSG